MIQLGLVLLIATPVARVAFSVVAFSRLIGTLLALSSETFWGHQM